MSVTNPYGMRKMIPIESDMFFGRESEMRRIKAMLAGEVPQCVSIIGERRIGKSSLAFRLFHQMRNADNILAVFLDCHQFSRHCRTEEQFFALLHKNFLDEFNNQEIIKKFCRGPGDGFSKESPGRRRQESFFKDYVSFRDFLKTTGGNRVRIYGPGKYLP